MSYPPSSATTNDENARQDHYIYHNSCVNPMAASFCRRDRRHCSGCRSSTRRIPDVYCTCIEADTSTKEDSRLFGSCHKGTASTNSIEASTTIKEDSNSERLCKQASSDKGTAHRQQPSSIQQYEARILLGPATDFG